jgi:hypothetical protein
MKRILLAGEGPNELGRWSREPVYARPLKGTPRRHAASSSADEGVLESLLRRICPGGWYIDGGVVWKGITKLRPGKHRGEETRNVLGLLNEAKENGFDVVVFCRDRDNDPTRQQAFDTALREAQDILGGAPEFVGTLAVERLESWLVALLGKQDSEGLSDDNVDRLLLNSGVPRKDTRAMCQLVEKAVLDRVPQDARSLHLWMQKAREVLLSR